MIHQLGDLEIPSGRARPCTVWRPGVPIVVDFGSYQTRVGMASEPEPSYEFVSRAAKYRDRKTGENVVIVGNDTFLDLAARPALKPTHDMGIPISWDAVEQVLDYSFTNLGVTSKGNVDSPIAMSELLAGPHAPRHTMAELLFEGYGVPKAAFGIDALFAFRHNCGTSASGVVISAGHEATYIIPIVDGKAELQNAKRISWGGRQAADYMQQLLALKYPLFPTRLTSTQAAHILRNHCYVSENYSDEVANYLALDGLEERERIIQVPIVGGKGEKTEEDLAKITERRRETGRRLQEQAAQARKEKAEQQERQLAILLEIDPQDESALEEQGVSSEQELEQMIRQLQAGLRKSNRDESREPEEEVPPQFPLVDIPDDKLDPNSLKEKRKQRLLKASFEARQKAKQEKAALKKQREEEEQREADWRERDLQGWISAKREDLDSLLARTRERKKLRSQLSDRKSLAFKLRMKSIAKLASEGGGGKKRKIPGSAQDDSFGANDDDWQVYRNAVAEPESDEEEDLENINALQQALLEFDPEFTVEDINEPTKDWRSNVVHLFLYGGRPLDAGSKAQNHQLNVNVERIRVPEVLLQPQMAGVDQAGIAEIAGDLLTRQYGTKGLEMAKNVLLTGGLANIKGLAERVHRELCAMLPFGAEIGVRVAEDPSLDAWKGMAQWSVSKDSEDAYITRAEYEEHGSRYFKKHAWGNIY